jgi:hypothetical protein
MLIPKKLEIRKKKYVKTVKEPVRNESHEIEPNPWDSAIHERDNPSF